MDKSLWGNYLLKNVIQIKHGKDYKDIPNKNSIYPVYGSGEEVVARVDEYNCEKDTIILGRKGTIDKPRFIDHRYWNIDTAFSISTQTGYSPKYVYYFFLTVDWKSLNSGAAKPSLTQALIYDQWMKIPSTLSEQQEIVDYLDASFAKIDALKKNVEESLANAKALFQASLRELLEPKEGWEEMPLGIFAHMKAGDFVKASDIFDSPAEGLYPCYGGNGLRGYVKEPNQNGDYCLIGRQGALCGNINLASGSFRATEHAVVVKPYTNIPPRLTYYLLTALNINQYATGAAQPGISVKNIEKEVRINIPPKNKWVFIASTLDALSEKVSQLQANYEKTIKECDALKQALLRDIFE